MDKLAGGYITKIETFSTYMAFFLAQQKTSMANGHVEIHDPFSTNDSLKSSSDQDGMDDTVEFRLLMAYAKRRRPASVAASPTGNGLDPKQHLLSSGGASSPDTPANGTKSPTTKKKKKKKRKSSGVKLPKFLSCFKPQMKDDEQLQPQSVQHDVNDRCGTIVEGQLVVKIKLPLFSSYSGVHQVAGVHPRALPDHRL